MVPDLVLDIRLDILPGTMLCQAVHLAAVPAHLSGSKLSQGMLHIDGRHRRVDLVGILQRALRMLANTIILAS